MLNTNSYIFHTIGGAVRHMIMYRGTYLHLKHDRILLIAKQIFPHFHLDYCSNFKSVKTGF